MIFFSFSSSPLLFLDSFDAFGNLYRIDYRISFFICNLFAPIVSYYCYCYLWNFRFDGKCFFWYEFFLFQFQFQFQFQSQFNLGYLRSASIFLPIIADNMSPSIPRQKKLLVHNVMMLWWCVSSLQIERLT